MTNRTTPVGTVDEELVGRLRQAANGLFPPSPLGDYGVCDEAATRIEQLLNRVERQREALKPFAAAYEDCCDGEGFENRHSLWEHPAAMDLTVGDLRTARAALTGEHQSPRDSDR
jgi:hypothetical protein